MSNWPEPTRDETEPPRWGKMGAVIALAAIGAWLIFNDDRPRFFDQSVRLPEIALRGREEAPTTGLESNDAALSPDLIAADVDGVITRPVPFKDCLALIFDTGNAVGVEPVLTEQSTYRAIARLPLQDGGVTVTCSAREGTMTIEQSGGQ